MKKFLNFLWVVTSYVAFIANIWLLAAPFAAATVVELGTTFGGGVWTPALTGYVNSTVFAITPEWLVVMAGLLLINLNVMLATRFRVLRNVANYVNVAFGAAVVIGSVAVLGTGFYLAFPATQLVLAFAVLTLGYTYLDVAVRHLRADRALQAITTVPVEKAQPEVEVFENTDDTQEVAAA